MSLKVDYREKVLYAQLSQKAVDIELINLDTIDENTEPIELKTHETIYLEIYKKAKQKAKEIRKNAIEAFLEAKNIKNKYNLNTIMEDSSSDEENELLNLN